MEKEVRRGAHAPSGQRGVDVAALLLLLAERHLLRRYSKSQEFNLSLRYSSYLCSTSALHSLDCRHGIAWRVTHHA